MRPAQAAVMELLERGLTPSASTREAFENGIAAGAATGGSTNLVLHLARDRPRGRIPPTSTTSIP